MKRTIFATILVTLSLALPLCAQTSDAAVDTDDLCESLRNADGQARQNAIDALIARGKGALETINNILLDKDDAVQREITALIQQLGDPDWAKRIEAHRKLARMGAVAVRQVTENMNNPDREIAMRCTQIAKILGETQKNELHLRRNQFTALLIVIKNIADPVSLPALHKLAADSDLEIRRKAIDAIATIADESSAEVLFKALQDEDRRITCLAILGLSRMDDPRALELMKQVIADPSQNDYLRRTAVLAMKKKDHRQAVDILLEVMEDDHFAARHIAFKVVQYLTGCTEDFGYDYVGDDEQSRARRAEAIKKWKEWWKEHREQVLARQSRADKPEPAPEPAPDTPDTAPETTPESDN